MATFNKVLANAILQEYTQAANYAKKETLIIAY